VKIYQRDLQVLCRHFRQTSSVIARYQCSAATTLLMKIISRVILFPIHTCVFLAIQCLSYVMHLHWKARSRGLMWTIMKSMGMMIIVLIN